MTAPIQIHDMVGRRVIVRIRIGQDPKTLQTRFIARPMMVTSGEKDMVKGYVFFEPGDKRDDGEPFQSCEFRAMKGHQTKGPDGEELESVYFSN